MCSGTPSVREPRGPVTVSMRSASVTMTPAGIVVSLLPILDILSPLPDEADDLAAKPFLASLHVGHQPLRGGDDCHTGAHENARYCILLHIDAAAWKTDTLQAGNVTTTSFCILEIELQVLAVIANDLRDTTNITLLLENQRECTVHLRIRGNGRIVEYQVCISHPGQEIRKCVNSGHVSSSTS